MSGAGILHDKLSRDTEAFAKVSDRIETYNSAGGTLLVWLTDEDRRNAPKWRRFLGIPYAPPSRSDWINWADDIACRAHMKGLKEARDIL